MTTADKLIEIMRAYAAGSLILAHQQQWILADRAEQLVKGGPESFSENQVQWIGTIFGLVSPNNAHGKRSMGMKAS